MGATLTEAPLTVAQARRALANTRRLSPQQLDACERTVAQFHAARPTGPCAACGCARWSEHEAADGNSTWACAGCHRASSLTFKTWHAQLAAKREADALRAATEAADAPEPRAALQDALAARLEASSRLEKLEQAQADALSALSVAQSRHADAVAGMQAAEMSAIERAAGQRTARSSDVPVDAARAKLRFFEDALTAARGARSLLDDKLRSAKNDLARAHDAVREAALRVIAREEFETTLATAVAARADYLGAVGDLAWLIRHGCIPSGDIRAHQLVAEASATPPCRWPEAADAGARLAQRLTELESATPL